MRNKKKIIRAATVSQSCNFFREVMIKLRDDKYHMIALSSPGKQLTDLQKEGFKIIEVPMERHISIKNDIKSLYRLLIAFVKEKPYVVHSITPKAGLLCMIAAYLTRVPVRIHTFTGLVWPTASGLQKLILKTTDRITCFCATHINPEGYGILNDLKKGRITRKKMKVLGYGNIQGIDLYRFSKRPELQEKIKEVNNESSFTFLFVGRIVGDKGINELVEAFCRLYEERPEVRLNLVGFFEENLDPVRPETKKRIEECPGIIAAGERNGDDLVAEYAAADCFVFPSYREGFPNTVLEAGAMGLPSIVTDINGSREIITDIAHAERDKTTDDTDRHGNLKTKNQKLKTKTNGIIIPPKDAEALYEAMKLMVTDDGMREAMARNARPMIESRFEQGFVRQCLYDFYEDILDS